MSHEDEFIEFSSDEISTDISNLSSPEEDEEKLIALQNAPLAEEENTKERKVRKYFILGVIVALLIVASDRIFWMVVKRDKERAATQKEASEEFHFSADLAQDAAQKVIDGDISYTVKTESASSAYEFFQQTFKPNTTLDKDPKLSLDTYPNYFILKTSTSKPIYVVESESKHAVDLEATVGYNSVKREDFVQFKSPQVKYVRVIIHGLNSEKSDRYYGCVSASLPNQSGTLDLRYEKYTEVGKDLELNLKKTKDLQYTVEISPYNPTGQEWYFISEIQKRSWVYNVIPEIDMDAFNSSFE